MVLASLRAPHAGIYVIQDVCELAEDVDADRLWRAWRMVAQRHPALRTSIEFKEGYPVSAALHDDPPILQQDLDWTGLSAVEQERKLAEFLGQDRERGFDLHAGVPVRFTVLRRSRQSSTIVWTTHHALLDGRSYLIVWKEWLTLYDAFVRGEELVLPQPADTEGGDPMPPGAEQHWRTCFDGLSQTTDYIVDRLRPTSGDSWEEPVAKESIQISEESTRQIREFARSHDISVNNLVQAAWALLLSRYSGRTDVIFGVTRAGRGSGPGERDKVGLFLNTLPLRVAVTAETTVVPWLKQIRSHWEAMREFEHTPLEQIVHWSGLPPGMPPFESVVVYEHELPSEGLKQLGGHWQSRTLSRFQRTDSPLTLAAYGSPVLTLELIYDTRLFCNRTMAAATGHLKTLLASMVAQPEARLGLLRMLTEEEESWLREEYSRNTLAFPPEMCAHQLFEQQVDRTPSGVALASAAGSLTYEELDHRANQLAWCLSSMGAGPENLIAVCMSPSLEAVAAVLAVLKAGAAFLPLDPTLPVDRLLSMLSAARPGLVLCTEESAAALEPAGDFQRLTLEQLLVHNPRRVSERHHNRATPSNTAYTIFTSGSTGTPKAVVVSHRALVNHTLAASAVYVIGENDRRLQFASIGADVFVAEVFNYLACGATLVFGWNRQKGSVREFLRYLDEQQITITGIPSAWWNEWVAALGQRGSETPRFLRAVIIGMEKASPAALLAWKRAVGAKVRLFNAYGPAETSPTATVYEAGTSEWESGLAVPIGKPIANMRTYVLDDDGNQVPVGVAGQLYIGGPGVSRGYLNSLELTTQRFVADRFTGDPADRVYKTGDIAFRLPDGNLVFLGRTDRQVKIRGFRVELEEIEAVLLRHGTVGQCAVLLAGADGEETLVAYIVPRGAEAPPPDQLQSFLAKQLPAHMLPAAFVSLPEMPMTANGKTDLPALLSLRVEKRQPGGEYQPPSTPVEKRLAAIWCEMLGVPRVGTTDNFFELGAGSLHATRLITLIEKEFGHEIPLALLWRTPTIAHIAAHLEESNSPGPAAEHRGDVLALQPKGSRPPLFCISSLKEDPLRFHELPQHLGSDQPVFAIPNPMRPDEAGQTVQDVAHRLCDLIRSVRRHGPYVIGGYCFGGILAFETARQLLAAGEEVRLVALFDAAAPGYPRVFPRQSGDSSQPGRLGIMSEVGSAARRALTRLHARAQPRFAHVGRSARAYTPQPISAPVVQFVAREDPVTTWLIDDQRLAWRDVCEGGFQVHLVPGSHSTMLSPPHAAELAALLKASLGQ